MKPSLPKNCSFLRNREYSRICSNLVNNIEQHLKPTKIHIFNESINSNFEEGWLLKSQKIDVDDGRWRWPHQHNNVTNITDNYIFQLQSELFNFKLSNIEVPNSRFFKVWTSNYVFQLAGAIDFSTSNFGFEVISALNVDSGIKFGWNVNFGM